MLKNNRYCYLNWGIEFLPETHYVDCFFFGTHFYLEVNEPAGIVVGPKFVWFDNAGKLLVVPIHFDPSTIGQKWYGKTKL